MPAKNNGAWVFLLGEEPHIQLQTASPKTKLSYYYLLENSLLKKDTANSRAVFELGDGA